MERTLKTGERFLLPAVFIAFGVLRTADAATEIRTLKRLHPQTAIVSAGRPAACILRPDGREFEQLADRLRAGIQRRTRAVLPIRLASETVDADWRIDLKAIGRDNIIALGDINNNRLLAALWGEGYVVVDSIYPYRGGYVIRTVHDPFACGVNVLVLAGSDGAGVARAIDVLLRRYAPERASDWTLSRPVVDVRFTPVHLPFVPEPVSPENAKRQLQYRTAAYYRERLLDGNGGIRRIEKGNVLDVLGPITAMGASWFWNGDKRLPPLMKAFLDRNRGLLDRGLERVEMEPGTAGMLPCWDNIEELPVWTDQDRLDITNAFLRDSRLGHERRAVHGLVKQGYAQVIDENHGTHAAWMDYLAWRYFDKYYHLPECRYWMKVAGAIYAGQCASHQILEDSSGYMCYIPDTTMSYVFACRDLRYLRSGIAEDLAAYIAQTGVNNLGLSTGFGDAPSLLLPAAYQLMEKAAWFYRDPELTWVVQRLMPPSTSLRAFQAALPYDLTVRPEKPTGWTGLRLFPIYKMPPTGRAPRKQPAFAPREPVGPEWFNKVVFREDWDPDAQYLLLDTAGKWLSHSPGLYPPGPAGHKHDDVNTIINFTDEGRMWLVDHTYSLRSIKDHSGLYILRDGRLSYRVHEARVRNHAEGGALALCRSVYENFSGSDWERTILWKRGRFFVIVDRVIAKEPGTFMVRCSFRGLGRARVQGARLRLEQKGKFCDIISDGEARLDLERRAYDNPSEWARWYPYAEPVVKVFQEDKSRRLKKAETLCFVNLLAAAGSKADLDALRPLSVSDSCVLVYDGRNKQDLGLFGVGDAPGHLSACAAFAVTRHEALFVGLTRLGPRDAPIFRADSPVTLYWNTKGEVWLETSRTVGIGLPAAGASTQVGKGRHTPAWPGAGPSAQTFFTAALARARELVGRRERAESRREAAQGPGRAASAQRQGVRLEGGLSDLLVCDLDGDGREKWIAADALGIDAYRPDGTRVWRFRTPKPVHVLDAGDLDGDGRPEIAAGCEDGKVYLLNRRGRLRWTFACKPSQRKAGPLTPDMVRIVDLDGDGRREVVVGANWVHCLDAHGRVRWEDYLTYMRGRICGDFRCGAIADFNGDGKKDLLALFYYTYHSGMIFGPDGKVIFPPNRDRRKKAGFIKTPLPQCVIAGDLFGGSGAPHFVLGSDQSLLAYWASGPRAGQAAGSVGGDFRALALYRPTGQPPIVFGGTDMGVVVAVRGERGRDASSLRLRTLWRATVGRKIRALWAGVPAGAKRALLLVGTKPGAVFAFDAESGKPQPDWCAKGRASVVKFVKSKNGVLVVHRDGTIETLTPPHYRP